MIITRPTTRPLSRTALKPFVGEYVEVTVEGRPKVYTGILLKADPEQGNRLSIKSGLRGRPALFAAEQVAQVKVLSQG